MTLPETDRIETHACANCGAVLCDCPVIPDDGGPDRRAVECEGCLDCRDPQGAIVPGYFEVGVYDNVAGHYVQLTDEEDATVMFVSYARLPKLIEDLRQLQQEIELREKESNV